MMTQRFWIAALLAGFGQAVLSLPSMADEQPKEETDKAAIEKALEKIVFIPHDVGAPEVTDAGGVRSISTLPNLVLLAPTTLSLSLSDAPMLYWYLPKNTDAPVRFTLLHEDPSITDPILDIDLGLYPSAGIYAVPLENYGIVLEDNQRYAWSVALSPADGNVRSTVAQSWFEHSPSANIVDFMGTMSPLDQITYLASKGYWYDAIETVSARIQADDRSASWYEIRAHLLDQVGLKQAAAFDRGQRAR